MFKVLKRLADLQSKFQTESTLMHKQLWSKYWNWNSLNYSETVKNLTYAK